MKKKILLLMMPFLVASTFVLGCGHRPTKTDEYVQEQAQKEVQTLSANIYYISQDASQILSEEMSYEKFDENFVLDALKELKVLPENVKTNSISVSESNNKKEITVDFDKSLVDYLDTLSNSQEFGTVTAIANSYLEYFEADQFVITVNSKQLKTNNRLYDAYLVKYEGQDNPEFGKFATQNIDKLTNEYTKAFDMLQALKSDEVNVAVSPLLTKMQLLNIYEGASDENRAQIDKYLEDTQTVKERAEIFATSHVDNFENTLIHHEGKVANVTFADSYLSSVQKYETMLHGIDYTQPTVTKNANDFINNLSFDVQSDVFEEVDTNASLFDVSTLNIEAVSDSDFLLRQEGVFYNASSEEVTTSYLMTTESLPYFETSDLKGVVKNLKDSKYSLVLIQPKQINIDYSKIDFANILDYYSLSDETVRLTVPEFTTFASLSTMDYLKQNGVNDIFVSGKAQFLKMFTEDRQSFVSDIKQFNKLSFTANISDNPSVDIESYDKEVTLDRPFVYAVFDNESNEVILIGQVNNL